MSEQKLFLDQPQNMSNVGTDVIGELTIKTIGGLNAKEIVDAKLALFKAYGAVQVNLNQPRKEKQGARFKNGQSYKYSDLNDVLTALQDAIKNIDIAYIQQPIVSGANTGVHNYLINSRGAIMDFGTFLLPISSPRPQESGSALTYARRYSISSIFGIASEDTDAQEFQYKPDYLAPGQIAGLTIMYDGKRTDLTTVYAKALAGDELAKQVIKDKGNSVNTKVAIKSINSLYEFNKKLADMEEQEREKNQQEDQEKINKAAADIIDPPYTETEEFKKQVDKEPKTDPFDAAMKKAGE